MHLQHRPYFSLHGMQSFLPQNRERCFSFGDLYFLRFFCYSKMCYVSRTCPGRSGLFCCTLLAHTLRAWGIISEVHGTQYLYFQSLLGLSNSLSKSNFIFLRPKVGDHSYRLCMKSKRNTQYTYFLIQIYLFFQQQSQISEFLILFLYLTVRYFCFIAPQRMNCKHKNIGQKPTNSSSMPQAHVRRAKESQNKLCQQLIRFYYMCLCNQACKHVTLALGRVYVCVT